MSADIASSSDSSSHDIGKYDVFLSFSGKDTRHTFTGNLYRKLKEAGFHAFLDDDGIERGRNIKSELQKAIQESRISIVILSRNYASSGWCLDELVMILQRRKNHRLVVLPVFYDMDPSDFRNHTGSVAEAFLIHEEKLHTEYYTRPTKKREAVCYESAKDKITGWRAALIQVADLAGVPYNTQIEGYEYKCIEKIVKVVENTLRRSPLSTDLYLVGIDSRVWEIDMWFNNNSNDAGILVIYGIGGIGKTTIAKWVYSANMKRFDSSSFLTSIRQLFKRPNGLLHLQKKLLSDILGQPQIKKPPTENDGWELIKRALRFRRVLLVLDDLDQQSQLYEILQMRNWLRKGSKIIITTRRLDLSRAQEAYQMYKVQELSPNESLELFCWHAFGQDYPEASHEEVAMHFVAHCQGLPLALKVIGSSLYNKSLVQWKDQLEKLREFPNKDVTETLKISFESLDDENDMNIFLDIACFFVGKDKDFTVAILQGCNFYASIGIQNLIDRCLLTINQRNRLLMHQLIQDMGKRIVREKSKRYPENCSRLWNHKDSLDVLRSERGTEDIEGLILDLKTSIKKPLETSAFERMHNLRILQLNFARLNGCYNALSRKLKWFCWHGFNLNSIPNGFPLEGLVVLDMRHSTVKYLWQGTKSLQFLKILNFSHSHLLNRTPDFTLVPCLEKLLLKDCPNLVEIHASLSMLKKLIILNLKDCKRLRKLPKNTGMLKSLEQLIISGCVGLVGAAEELKTMSSLKVLVADEIFVDRVFSTGIISSLKSVLLIQVLWWLDTSISCWLSRKKRTREISWTCLPKSLVDLSLVSCNLSDNDFTKEFSNLIKLQNLNLGNNPFECLPGCIRSLTNLKKLGLRYCQRLRLIEGSFFQLQEVDVSGCCSLEKISFKNSSSIHKIGLSPEHARLRQMLNIYAWKFVREMDVKALNTMGFFNLESMPYNKVTYHWGVFSTYIPGREVPKWFTFKSVASVMELVVPPHPNLRIQGINLCMVHTISSCYNFDAVRIHAQVINKSKNLVASKYFGYDGIHEDSLAEPLEPKVWLSYWLFGSLFESGDHIKVSFGIINDNGNAQIKECGIHLLYDHKEERDAHDLRSLLLAGFYDVDFDAHSYDSLIPSEFFDTADHGQRMRTARTSRILTIGSNLKR